jgi:UDP-glucose 4-epimerase
VYGLETVSLRLFNVFGPGQDPLSQYAAVVPRFIAALLSGNRPIVYGDGTQTRDFTYVEDVVDAFVLAAETPSAASGDFFNVAAGGETSILSLIDALGGLFGNTVEPQFQPARPGEVHRSWGDARKVMRVFGWKPKWSITNALRECIDAFRAGVELVPR